MRVAYSTNRRVEWAVASGRLSETGAEFPKFTLSATDTKTLKDLLMALSEEIDLAAAKDAIDAVNGTISTPVYEFSQPLPEHQKKQPKAADRIVHTESGDILYPG
jgi:hypothetical protein